MTALAPISEIEAPDASKSAKLARAPSTPDRPVAIYEVHLDSWMRAPEEGNRPLTCAEIAPRLADHVARMQFTHVQIQAPGDVVGLKFLIDYLRGRGVGVILNADFSPGAAPPLAGGVLDADGECARGRTIFSHCAYLSDVGWADDTCAYFSLDPLFRKLRHTQFRRRDGYAFAANYILPLSHELVARPRPSLLSMMPGDEWQKFANMRLLFAYMYLLPGKKLVFMGDEFGQLNSWRPETSIDWHLVAQPNNHRKLMDWVAALNTFYFHEPALHQTDSVAAGFQWIDTSDAASSVISFLRIDAAGRDTILAAFNFTPVPRHNYRVGAPRGGFWTEALNSDALEHGGSGQGNLGGVEAAPFGWNFLPHSLMLTLPPLGAVVLKAPLNDVK